MAGETEGTTEQTSPEVTLSEQEEFKAVLDWAAAALKEGELRLVLRNSDDVGIEPTLPGGWQAVTPPEAEDVSVFVRLIKTEVEAYINAVISDDLEAGLRANVPPKIVETDGGWDELLRRCGEVKRRIDLRGVQEWQSTRRLLQGKVPRSFEWTVARGIASSSEGEGGPVYGVARLGIAEAGKAGRGFEVRMEENVATFTRAVQESVTLTLHRRDVDRLIEELTNLRKELEAHERQSNEA